MTFCWRIFIWNAGNKSCVEIKRVRIIHILITATYPRDQLVDLDDINTPDQWWGLLSQFSPFRYFPHFPLLSKQTLAIEYHVYIWHVSPQLSCGDTCQIWMWFRESNRYFCKIKNFAYGKISERSFSKPHPRGGGYWADFLRSVVFLIFQHRQNTC